MQTTVFKLKPVDLEHQADEIHTDEADYDYPA
jgi:hypothetical protein